MNQVSSSHRRLDAVVVAIGVAAMNALFVLVLTAMVFEPSGFSRIRGGDLLSTYALMWAYATFLTLMVSAALSNTAGSGLPYLGKVFSLALVLSALGNVTAWWSGVTGPGYLAVTAYFMLIASMGHLAFRYVMRKLIAAAPERAPT